MQTIRIKISTKDDHFYEALRTQVAAYLRTQPNGPYGNAMMLLKALVYLPLYWGLYVLALRGGLSGGGFILTYALLGMAGLFVAFNLSHDAIHGSLTPWKGFNKAL